MRSSICSRCESRAVVPWQRQLVGFRRALCGWLCRLTMNDPPTCVGGLSFDIVPSVRREMFIDAKRDVAALSQEGHVNGERQKQRFTWPS